jgi:type I restriction enzyme R subunit
MDDPTEARTRTERIDPELERAGWDVYNRTGRDQVRFEIPVDGFDPAQWRALEARLRQIREQNGIYEGETPRGISDYALYRENGEIIAIIEDKRARSDPRLAEAQADFYVTEIEKRQGWSPFAFLSNGYDIYFYDAGRSARRLVAGFYSPSDLENLLFLRENALPLADTPINSSITDRPYQQEAIRRVCEAFGRGKRKTLVVMATGTGKTRVAMSIVDVFLRANQARRILFVADRDALVTQALVDGFQRHIPDEPCTRLFSYNIDKTNRLYAVTLQTLSNIYPQFTPGFFDLIIFDEVHRSIFNKWSEVVQYFDGRMIGLTATPADFIDRNTFLAFDCPDGVPDFLYTYAEAIREGYLVDYTLYRAKTNFQAFGIHGPNLTEEERNSLIEQGIDPDQIDYSGSQLEKDVSNKDTIRRQWEEVMEVCYKDQSGQLPGKTILFAMTQDHALRLEEIFNEMYPQYPGLVKVITYKSEYRGQLVERFKHADQPRIALSVDMLETGIDVPEVVNLVFMRPVQSRIKLDQMLGRGTRPQAACRYFDRLPEGKKNEFLVIDFWENDFNRTPDLEIAQSLPVLVTIFNTRLSLLERYLGNQGSEEAQRVIANLREMVDQIPVDSFTVRRLFRQIEHAWQDAFWAYLTRDKLDFLRSRVGPLLRFALGEDIQGATFTSKVERLKLQILTGRDATATAQAIAEDVSRLPEFVYNDPERNGSYRLCLSPSLQNASQPELNRVIDSLANQMKYRMARASSFLVLDLPDFVAMRGFILLHGGSQPVYVEDYRQQVEERILSQVIEHPTVQALARGEAVSDDQLLELERTLRQELGSGDLELNEGNILKAYAIRVGSLLEFLRYILDLQGIPDYREIVSRQFDSYIQSQNFTADQIRFLRAVEGIFLQKHSLKLPDLYEPPLTAFGQDAVERLFAGSEIDGLLKFTEKLAIGEVSPTYNN